jgi:hypothetical protein
MTRAIQLIITVVILSCGSKQISNEYVFSQPPTEWFVIVNGCKNSSDFTTEAGIRRLEFPANGILLSNIPNFEITKNDIFLVGGKQFDPNSTDPKSYKLCYHMTSKRAGYDNEEFDFYFFRVNLDCNIKQEKTLTQVFDDLLNFLKSNHISSIR